MQAIVTHGYGPFSNLRLEDVPRPVPAEGEVLVKVHAAAMNPADWRMQRADPFLIRLAAGLFRPKFRIPGADAAGRVEAVGKGVSSLGVGDEVFADLSNAGWGAFAQFVAAPEKAWAPKPAKLSFAEAAAIPLAGVTALQGLRDHGRLQRGHHVLINGASGGVGTFAVQIAKAFGARVTGVCSTRNVDRVLRLGADHVMDYTKSDPIRSGERYDLILDAAAYRPAKEYRESLAPKGVYVLVGGKTTAFMDIQLTGRWMSKKDGKSFKTFLAKPNRKDLEELGRFVEQGLVKPVIDRRVPLPQAPAAYVYMQEGHTRGKVVLIIAE